MTQQALLSARAISKYFPIRGGLLNREVGQVHAVNGIDLDVYPGETLGIVGESGSGKSTFGRMLLQIIQPSSGSVTFEGQTLNHLNRRALHDYRRKVQMIFQDPFSSLNPRMPVGEIIEEPLLNFGLCPSKQERQQKVTSLMERVGIDPAMATRYPHEFSGGQRQRVGIARALAPQPKLIIADEPISALDVSIQAQILNLMADLQEELGLTYIFITHDISVLRYFCERVAVMQLGKLVEQGPTDKVCTDPSHPYTQKLMAAVPQLALTK